MTNEERKLLVEEIRILPNQIELAIKNLNNPQLDTPYGEGKWTIRQVIHHIADSHMHAYIRTKWTFTENEPRLKTYEQNDWAILSDAKTAPIDFSLSIISGIHSRWHFWFSSLNENDFSRKAIHPENGEMTLDLFLKIYCNHGKNHCKQITDLRERMKW